MSKLIFANLARLKKSKLFPLCVVFVAALGLYIAIGTYVSVRKYEIVAHTDDNLFMFAMPVAVAVSVFAGLFVGTDYSEGTIRNKIVAGCSRTSIYLSNLAVNMLVCLCLCSAFLIGYLPAALPLLGALESDAGMLISAFAVAVFALLALSALFTMIPMICSNKALVAVACILLVFLLLFFSSVVNARLQEPPTYPSVIITDSGAMEEADVENPFYPDGIKRSIYEFLNDFLPGGQIMQCMNFSVEFPGILILYSAAILGITTVLGIILFKRKDIA